MGQWCLRLSDQSREQWELDKAVAALSAAKDCELLPREKSFANIVPETVAAITGYLNRPGTRSGRFITFDVGAGTTDVSVFWLEKHDGKIRPWYYASGSLHVGMDDIDRSLKDIVHTQEGPSLRSQREALQRSAGGLRKYQLHCEHLIKKIGTHKRRQFGIGYGKEPLAKTWGNRQKADVTMLMIGGGCQVDVIQQLAGFSLWESVLGAPTSELLDLELTDQALLPNGARTQLRDVESLSGQAKLLIIAEGLANRIVDIPPFGITRDSVVKPTEPTPIPPDLWYIYGIDETWKPSHLSEGGKR